MSKKVTKNSIPTQSPLSRLLKKYSLLISLVGYAILVTLTTILLVWRFPNNVTHPNFYAEDGSIFLQNILNKGWLHATFTSFNGYFVVGMYGIEGLGWMLNVVFGHGGLLTLSQYFAFTSVLFMAAIIALPFLLLRRAFGTVPMLLIVIFGALLPLPISPQVVIGTVGNQKWIFLYLAVILVLYRLLNHEKLGIRKSVVIDSAILVCAYTNATTYTLLPLLYVPYLIDIWKNRHSSWWSSIKAQIQNPELISLFILSVLLLPQIAYVALHGIPVIPGYLTSPYQGGKTVEIFLNRTLLFGVTHLFNGHMNDTIAVLLTTVLFAIGWFWLKGKEKAAFWLSIYSATMGSLLFVTNRPGVSEFFLNYQPSGSGPDQFFYAQTLIMYLPITLAAFAVARRLPARLLKYFALGLFSMIVILSALVSNARYDARWRNASVYENYTNTFIDQALLACNTQRTTTIHIVLYPYADGQFQLSVPRRQICTPQLTEHYQPSYQPLNLVPNNNDFQIITQNGEFSQTFTASENNFNGIRILLSDFNNYRRSGVYMLNIYDNNCKYVVRQSPVPTVLLDNSYYDARFKPILHSQGHAYCFSLVPPSIGGFSPIAIQKSSPGVYPAGQLIVHGAALPSDVVFQPLYTQIKP